MFKRSNIIIIITIFFFCSLIFCKKTNSKQASENRSLPDSIGVDILVDEQDTLKSPEKWALLIGIDKYRYAGSQSRFLNLAGCVNDVMNMKNLLIGKFGFNKDNIKMLTNEQATHSAIVQAFLVHLIGKAQKDDIVVVHFSGHGSKMKDMSGDEIDRFDETLVPYDSRDPAGKVFDISDDEINELLRQLSRKTKNITFIFDSCHSGTAARGSGMARTILPDERTPLSLPYSLKNKGLNNEGDSDLRPKDLDYVLISGCKSDEISYEYHADGKIYGAMTYFLIQELCNSGEAVTYRDIMDNVKGNVNAVRPSQNPQFEGTNFDQYVFSDSTSISQQYILVSPSSTKNVKFSAGFAHGLSEGSIFEIYNPKTKKFEAMEKPIATVELTKLTSFSAEGKIIQGEQIPEFSRAIEREHKFSDPKFLVYYQNLEASKVLQKIKAEMDQFNYIKALPEPSGYHLLLKQIGNEIVTEGGDTTEISPRVNVNKPDAVSRVTAQINQWVRWFNVLSIVNPAPALEVNFTIKTINNNQSRVPFMRIGNPKAVLYEGEQFQSIVENKSRFRLYLSILDLSNDGSISIIYPMEPGAAEILPGDSCWTMSFKTYLPEGRESVKDILKAFLTTQPIDFCFLKQEPVRKIESKNLSTDMDDPLGQLLASALFGTTRSNNRPIKMGNWTTVQRILEIRRRKD